MEIESSIIGDEACPRCREKGHDKTGNHLICFSNGNKSCNRCGYKEVNSSRPASTAITLDEITSLPAGGDIRDRKLNNAFTSLYELRMGRDAETGEVNSYYMPVYETGTAALLGYQKRTLPKRFSYIGDIKKKSTQFVGQHLARESGKFLIIVEGFLDTIAAKQMLSAQKKTWTVVGAYSTSLAKQFQDNIAWLNGFETIVLALDQDKAGAAAVDKVLTIVPPNKLRIAKYSENDPCDMLKKGKEAEFVHSLSASKRYTPKGIVGASGVVKDYLKIRNIKGVPFPPEWEKVNEKTDGIRPGEMAVYTAGTGVGKSHACDEESAHLLIATDEKVGVLKMEHNNAVGLSTILGVGMQVNLKRHGKDYTDEQITDEWEKFFKKKDGGEKAFLINHGFSGIDGEGTFMGKLMALIVGAGCTTIIIDHLHAVMNDTGNDNDEVDALMYSLQRITQQYQIKTHIVMHLRKTGTGGKSFETGAIPSLDDLKGSGALKQVPDMILALSRDTQSEDDIERRVTTITVLKNRWHGETGVCDKLLYDLDKSKYFPFDEEAHETDKRKPEWDMKI